MVIFLRRLATVCPKRILIQRVDVDGSTNGMHTAKVLNVMGHDPKDQLQERHTYTKKAERMGRLGRDTPSPRSAVLGEKTSFTAV